MAVDIHIAYLVCLGHNNLAFFDSNLEVNYVTFGSEHQKLVGNPDRRHDVILLQHAVRRDFLYVTTVTCLNVSCKPHFNCEPGDIVRKPIKRRFQ